MDDLDDHMLTQILVRLPNCATVLSCGLLVNKRWCSLISDPNFSVQFANHKKKTSTLLKASGSDHEDNEPPWNFIPTRQIRGQPLIKECAFGSRKLSLEYLPCNILWVETTFKDLVLCLYVWNHVHRVYYITNPLTKQWVALPPCPRLKDQEAMITDIVLICQPPYYNHNTQDYKFRVVEVYNTRIMDCSLDIFDLNVYCSEIGEWKEINLRVPKEVRPQRLLYTGSESVVCNGIIYLNYGLCLVALDPFDVNASSDTTLEARVMPPLPDFGYLLESSGHLLVVHASKYDDIKPSLSYRKDGMDIKLEMVVWKLDPNQARLKWESVFQGLCKGTGNSQFNRTSFEGNICTMNIGVHPYNDKLIYMYLSPEGQLVLFDMRTRCITPSKLLPKYTMSNFHRLEHQW